MTFNKPGLAGIAAMSILALLAALSIMAAAQSHDADNNVEGRGERHEGGNEGSEHSSDANGEEDRTQYALDEIVDQVRGGARLILAYDATSNSFSGIVENVTDAVLEEVRVEVHLSNGIELGPTTPTALEPGEQTEVFLNANNIFDSWSTHAEVGKSEAHIEDTGDGCERRDESSETNGAEEEEDGAAYALDETYDEARVGARLILAYDSASNSFTGTVENITDAVLKAVRVEVHLSNGVELGPTGPADLAPGEQVEVFLDANNVFDSWTAHAEVGKGEAHNEAASDDCETRGENGERGERSENGERGEHREGRDRGEHGSNERDGD